MKHILLIGAGKSASSLIDYLKQKSELEDLHITIVDKNLKLAEKIAGNHQRFDLKNIDIFDEQIRAELIQKSDLVISMLPARFHMQVALDALKYGKHMVTASYISPELKALDDKIKAKGLVFMNEIGLDPGIDHMSAMRVCESFIK